MPFCSCVLVNTHVEMLSYKSILVQNQERLSFHLHLTQDKVFEQNRIQHHGPMETPCFDYSLQHTIQNLPSFDYYYDDGK